VHATRTLQKPEIVEASQKFVKTQCINIVHYMRRKAKKLYKAHIWRNKHTKALHSWRRQMLP